MLKIRVESIETNERSGVSVKTNKPWRMVSQEAWVYLRSKDGKNAPHPTAITIQLDAAMTAEQKDQPPYQIGDYVLPVSAIYVKRYGEFAISMRALMTAKEYEQQKKA